MWFLFFELWRVFKEVLRRVVVCLEVYFGRFFGSILLNILKGEGLEGDVC